MLYLKNMKMEIVLFLLHLRISVFLQGDAGAPGRSLEMKVEL